MRFLDAQTRILADAAVTSAMVEERRELSQVPCSRRGRLLATGKPSLDLRDPEIARAYRLSAPRKQPEIAAEFSQVRRAAIRGLFGFQDFVNCLRELLLGLRARDFALLECFPDLFQRETLRFDFIENVDDPGPGT